MAAQIREEAQSSAHRRAAAGVAPLAITPDRRGAKHAAVHAHMHAPEHTDALHMHQRAHMQAGNTSVM